jgi:predicted O-methyltransferase YrrM
MTGADTDKELAREAVRRGAYQKVPELEPLIALVRERRPRTVVEIGTDKGGTLWAWCRLAHPEASLVSIDLPKGLFGGGYSWRDARRFRKFFTQPDQRLHAVRRDSHDPKTVRRLERLLAGRSIDFLLIDGDHSYEGVKRDWELYEPLVTPGGLIAFHDILRHEEQSERIVPCEVDRFWEELAPHHRTVEFAEPNDDRGYGQWGGIGVVFKPEIDLRRDRPEPYPASSASA